MHAGQTDRIKTWKTVSEWISLTVVMYYVLICFYDSSRFTFTIFTFHRKLIIAAPLILAAGIRLLVCLWEELHGSQNKRAILIKTGLLFLLSLPFLIVSIKFSYGSIAYLVFAAFCLYRTDTDRVLKIFTVELLLLLVTTIVCSLTGVVDNLIRTGLDERHAGRFRGAYGICYPTDLAAYFVFLLLFFWCSRENKRDIWNTLFTICLILLVSWGIYEYTDTWTSVILCVLLLLFVCYDFMDREVLSQRHETRKFSRIINFLVSWSFPVLGISFYGLTWLYGQGNSLAVRVDDLLHSRLKYAWESIEKYGLHVFGALTPQHGDGGNLIRTWQGDYDFLDSSFALLLVRYGWILTIIVAVLWVWMTKKALKHGRKRIAYTMAVISVHCFIEHHFPELNYNILLATPFCLLKSEDSIRKDPVIRGREKKTAWIPWAAGGVMTAVLVLLLPGILSKLRAFFEIKRWTGGQDTSAPAGILVLCCSGVLALLWFFAMRISGAVIEKKKIKKEIAGMLISVAFLFSVHLWVSNAVNSTKAYDRQIEADTPAIHAILSSAEQPVYASQLEEYYKNRFTGVSDRIDSLESLSKDRKGTAITERSLESIVLLQTGAVYAEISEYSSVYTYDPAVIDALKKAGYSLHGFYSTEQELDLDLLAEMNHLVFSASGDIQMQAGEKLFKAPDLSLFGGEYQTEIDLQTNTDFFPETACDIEIRTYNGANIVTRLAVNADEFDDHGHLRKIIDYQLSDSAGVRFYVLPNIPLTVSKISYKKNPRLDIWKNYDQYNRLIADRYFDMEGNPIPQEQGRYGSRYQYEGNSRYWKLIQFIDQNNQIMTGTYGYAQVEHIFNQRKQLVEERYLDENGELCNIIGLNYAVCKMQYDDHDNITGYEYFDNHGQPILTDKGFAAMRRTYNENGQIVREEYFGISGEPINIHDGYHAVKYNYDEEGELSESTFFDLDGSIAVP